MEIQKIVADQRAFFRQNRMQDVRNRISALNRLYNGIVRYEEEFLKGLQLDLGKAPTESYLSEVGLVLNEITLARKKLMQWTKPKKVRPSLAQLPARCEIRPEPYGVVLIMSPWNYPFLLSLTPLIGAIAAGNCVVLKPSKDAPATSKMIKQLLNEIYPEHFVAVVEGGREENTQLLNQKFDYIFFTGGSTVGRVVMEKASQNLTPITLELGGKSPCIIDQTANLSIAAKRIVFGKLLNSGQTCIAPDYILVHESVKEQFTKYLIKWIEKLYGNPMENPSYPHMVNEKQYQRVLSLLEEEDILYGGYGNPNTFQIMPTILDNVSLRAPIMQEEIFGPILPLLSFSDIKEVEEIVLSGDEPLALYLFTRDKAVENRITRNLSFGGGCVNDTILHIATSRMPFGGVGASGMGRYHGKDSFDTFSHYKSILLQRPSLDIPLRYPPYCKSKEFLIRTFLK